MKKYDINKRELLSIGPHWLGIVFIVAGLFTTTTPLFMKDDNSLLKVMLFGSAFLLFGLIIIVSYSGTSFDFDRKRYKNYYSFSGYKIGQWQNLPEIRQIRVFSSTTRGSQTFDGIHPSFTGNTTSYKMAFYINNPKPVLVFENISKEKIIRDAKIMSDNLNVSLDIQ